MRQLQEVTLEQVCEGLCSVSMMKRIENGERLPEKQMRDRIMARMGVQIEEYEDYLSTEEYEQWSLRQKILQSLENKKILEAENYLEIYRVNEKQNVVEEQFCDAMELMILKIRKESLKKQQEVIMHAVELTMPQIETKLLKNLLLSEQEVNLLIEYVWLREYDGKPELEYEWRCRWYQEILDYITDSKLGNLCKVKVYPKAAYYLSELILHKSITEENLKLGIRICNEGIELLRDTRKLFYFTELVEVEERLVKAYSSFCLSGKRQEELEALQAALEEKKEWLKIVRELYIEYEVSPYMENDCYLYREMESYCIGDVIRIRRRMLGMTKEELCKGVCSVRTLTRIENKEVKTQMTIVRELFARLGLCAEYIRARIITSDYELLTLAKELVWNVNNRDIEKGKVCVKALKERLCLEIPQNKQFLMYYDCLLELAQKEISKEEAINKLSELIEYTIPVNCIMTHGEKFLSQEEYTYIRAIGIRAESELAKMCMEVIEEYCIYEKIASGHTKKYEFLMTSVISYFGNIGEYEKSNFLSTKLIKQCLLYRRSYVLAEAIYNNLWNIQATTPGAGKNEKMLRNCLRLSEYNRAMGDAIFFENKLNS